MSNLQLQVGKTYINRRGEEIKILEKNTSDKLYPYIGDNNVSYMETGVWCFGVKDYYDLVDEVATVTSSDSDTTGSEKHKHYDLIMQWAANPALEIEYRKANSGEWRISKAPAWIRHYQYRIKPQDKTEIRFFFADKNGAVKQGTGNRANLKLIYKNGVLQTAEVI